MAPLRALRRCWWLLPVLALAGAYVWQAGVIERGWARVSGGPPIAEYPAVVDLGERTPNEMVVHRVEVSNRGRQELVIDQVRSSCACGGLERAVDGAYRPLEELRLPPGGRAELFVRLTIRTDGAGTFSQTVSFATNDPAQPEGRIKVVFRTISGGVRIHPTAVQFGRVLVGREARQVVDVFDRDPSPQTVTKVVSADPARVAVNWTPATRPERSDAGALLGRIELVANPAQPRLLDTAVTVTFADPRIEPIVVQVSGRVVPRFEVAPASLVLPRSTGSGPVYTGNCTVRGYDGGTARLEVVSSPPDLKVELPESPGGANTVVQITWVPTPGEGRGTSRKTVRLRATAGEESETIDIPVTCEHPN